VRDRWIGLSVFAVVSLLYLPFARLGVDSHHDGIMLHSALVVSEGGVVHGDVFNQYGPVSSWVHAVWIWVFGPELLSIRMGTVFSLSGGLAAFFVAWKRLLGGGVAVVATSLAVLTTYFFDAAIPMHPWASDVAVLFLGLSTLLVSQIFTRRARIELWIVVGALAALITLTRVQVGVVLSLLTIGGLVVARERRAIYHWFSGAAIVSSVVIGYFWINGALDDWWFQTFEVPRSILATSSRPGFHFLRLRILNSWIPGLTLCLLFAGAVGGRLKSMVPSRHHLFLKVLYVVFAVVVVAVYRTDLLFFDGHRFDVLGVALLASLISVPWMGGWFIGQERSAILSEVNRWWIWIPATASMVQVYPVSDPRHLWWAAIPSLGPAVWLLGQVAVNNKRRFALGIVSVAVLVPSAGGQVLANFEEERISVVGVPVLDGMLVDHEVATTYLENMQLVSRYLEAHPQAPVLNMCSDGLFASLSENRSSPDPYFVFWPATAPAQNQESRARFIEEERPILWWCPPAPDPIMLARGYDMRLLPLGEEVPVGLVWPFVSRIAVPVEWEPLEEEPKGERLSAAAIGIFVAGVNTGLFDGASGGSVVVSGEKWMPEDFRNLVSGRGIDFFEALPHEAEPCQGGRWCVNGSLIHWFGNAVIEGQDVYFVAPVAQVNAAGSPLLDAGRMRLWGSIGLTPQCDFPAGFKIQNDFSKTVDGEVLRICTGEAVASLEDLVSWIQFGCRESLQWGVCSTAVSAEDAALVSAFIEHSTLAEPVVFVVPELDRIAGWGASGAAKGALESQRFEMVSAMPVGSESCGPISVCDVLGRPVHLLTFIERPNGTVLVEAPIAVYGSSLDESTVMINLVTIFGSHGVVPPCDFDQDFLGSPASSARWVSRKCQIVAPVQVAIYLDWVKGGCSGRSKWWICP
jgi:hypothetical protein